MHSDICRLLARYNDAGQRHIIAVLAYDKNNNNDNNTTNQRHLGRERKFRQRMLMNS